MLTFIYPASQVTVTGVALESTQQQVLTAVEAIDSNTDGLEAAFTTLNSKDFATQTTLSALNDKVTAVNTGAVVVSSSALPTGASTEATLSALNAKVTAVDTGAVVVSSSALPTGAATESTLSILNAKVTAVNTGAVTISSALPAGTNNIGDVDVLSLPALPAGSNNIGDVDVLTLPVAFNAGAASATTQRVVIASDQTAVLTQSDKSATATLANVSGSASSVTLQASNTSRKGWTIHNDSAAILYVKFGSTASSTSYTVKLVADAYYEMPTTSVYTGIITGIWASATGTARVTEY